MSQAAESLELLAARVDEAAGALTQARFGEFAELASELEQAGATWSARSGDIQGDADAEAACQGLRRALDRLGCLLGHVAGVQTALGALDPGRSAAYDRSGAGVTSGRTLLQEEA